MERELHFGMFHTGLEKGRKGVDFALKNPSLDLFICECDYRGEVFESQLTEIAAAGKKAFITFSYLLFRRVSREEQMVDVGGEYYAKCVLQPDYRERLVAMKAVLDEKPYKDAILGFYVDEPFLQGISAADFTVATKAMREILPEMRIIPCFCIAPVAPNYWTIPHVDSITPDCIRYITDIAYDLYHPYKSETYDKIHAEMHERMGDLVDKIRVWYVPGTMNYRGDKEETYALEHLYNFARCLEKEKNPGGLLFYTWITFPNDSIGNVGLEVMTEQHGWDHIFPAIDTVVDRLRRGEPVGEDYMA